MSFFVILSLDIKQFMSKRSFNFPLNCNYKKPQRNATVRRRGRRTFPHIEQHQRTFLWLRVCFRILITCDFHRPRSLQFRLLTCSVNMWWSSGMPAILLTKMECLCLSTQCKNSPTFTSKEFLKTFSTSFVCHPLTIHHHHWIRRALLRIWRMD